MSDPELYKDIGESMGTVFGIFVTLLRRVDALAENDLVYFDNKPALGRWSHTLIDMERRGLITTKLIEIHEEQYSRLEVRRVR